MSQTVDFYLSWLGNSAFGTSGIRLRDQEPINFKPTDISGCVLWLDANDNDVVTYNNLLQVSSWSNKGTLGGQFDASGAGLVEYGIVKQNGLNTVSFDDSGFLSGVFTFNFQARSVFVVVKPNTFPLSSAIPIFSSDTTNYQETFFIKNGTWVWFEGKHPSPIPENAFETTTDYTGYASVAEFVLGSDLSDNWSGINGSYISPIFQTTASYDIGSATYYLGNYFGGSPVTANVDYCEIIMYNTALRDADRENVSDYLRRKWAIVEPPPAPPVPPAPFVPTDISGLYMWFDANNTSTITTDVSSNVLTWSNLGLASNVLSNDSNYATYTQDINSNYVVAMPSEATLLTYATLPYNTRTTFAVFENVSDLPTLANPYENIWTSATSGGVSFGVNWDSLSSNYQMALCQSAYNCPVIATIPSVPIGGYNLAIWATDSNTTASTLAYWNGGSNINAGIDLGNLFNTGSIDYTIGSPISNSPDFRLGEIIEYDSLLTTSNISTVANYLVAKWAISSFVPLV